MSQEEPSDDEGLQRRLSRLFELIEKGKITFDPKGAKHTIKSLKNVKRNPDRTFDLKTVDGRVRAVALVAGQPALTNETGIVDDDDDEFYPAVTLPPLGRDRSTKDDFLKDLIEASNVVRQYLVLAAGIVPAAPVEKLELGILRGHMVRQWKLYDSLIFLTVKNRSEIAMILLRSLTETVISARYLLRYGSQALYQRFVKASLAYEKKLWEEVEKRKSSPPLPIERRIQEGVEQTFKRSGFSMDQVTWAEHNWAGGTAAMATKTDLGVLYEFAFRGASRNTHGTWDDLELHHLREENGVFLPEPEYTPSSPKMIEAPTLSCLDIAAEYARRLAGDAADPLLERLSVLSTWFLGMARLHEQFLQGKATGSDEAQPTPEA